MNTARTLISFDGDWTLAYDPDNRGLAANWHQSPPDVGLAAIQLPVMQAQGLAEHGGVGWFFHTFDGDPAWLDRHGAVQLEAANYPLEAWLNGARLGSHPGGGAPAHLPATPHLRAGSNLLAIRIAMGAGDSPPLYRYPLDTPGRVSLSVTPRAHLAGVFIQPDMRRKRVAVQVTGPEGATVDLQIEGTACHVQGAPGELVLEFPEFEAWTPDAPRCYTLAATLTAADGSVDQVKIPFAMREFTVKDNRYFLNNRPLYLKAVASFPHYPANLRADKLDLLLKREVELAKNAGFNALRIEGGPAPARLLDWASELGLLVFQTLAPPAASTDFEVTAGAIIARDRNQPALAAWCGLPSGGRFAAAVRAADPTRLLLCDGAEAEPQALWRPYRDAAEPCDAYTRTPGVPVRPFSLDQLRLSGDPDRLNTELALMAGGVSRWEDGSPAGAAAQVAFEANFPERQLDRCLTNTDRFYEASLDLQLESIRAQLDAIRCNTRNAGYCVRYLCDGPGVTPFGLADVRRQPKPALKALRAIQQEVRPAIQMQKYNLVPREEAGVAITLINEARIEGRGELSLQVVGPTNQVLWKKKRLVKIPRHARELWAGEIAASGSPGPHQFVVRLTQDRRLIGENAVSLHVVQPPKAEPVEINVLGGRSPFRSACGRFARLGNMLAPVHVIPPLANTIRAYPANDLMQVLAQVAEGAVAIVFQPPADWNDLAASADPALRVESRSLAEPGLVAHHYAKLHPILEGLPSRDLMRQPYQNVLPLRAFVSPGDEEISGVHCRYADGGEWWGANLVVRRLGAGRVVFTHLRILEHLGQDPVADRFFANLLQHFSRRSVPASETVEFDQKSAEWLNQERNNTLRKWMLIGSFPNWDGRSGHDTAHPPESSVDFDGVYPGWYRAVQWKPWWSRESEQHRIDFDAALDADAAPCRYATAYAYAEFSCDRRQEIVLSLESAGLLKAWLNGTPVLDSATESGDRGKSGHAWVRQGRNMLLIKCSKGPGPFDLSASVEVDSEVPLILNWWK
ncbi:MAG: hypothetical protein KF886_10540 [Candidatus Hydrogenedentes bacterium]|nr:hypothetical protein [Candidatus Hydrogenedentota bacterium]